MRIIQETRGLIAAGEVSQALKVLLADHTLSDQLETDIVLLSSQYEQVSRQQLLGLPYQETEKNRIIYAILQLLSHEEARVASKGSDRKRAQLLEEKEAALEKAYELLGDLQKQNPIDLFFDYLVRNHPESFKQLISLEPSRQADELFVSLVSRFPFEELANNSGVQIPAATWRELMLGRQSENAEFTKGWLSYQEYRKQYTEKIEGAIRQTKQEWKKIAAAGSVGLLLGGAFNALYENPIMSVISDFQQGISSDDSDTEHEDVFSDGED